MERREDHIGHAVIVGPRRVAAAGDEDSPVGQDSRDGVRPGRVHEPDLRPVLGRGVEHVGARERLAVVVDAAGHERTAIIERHEHEARAVPVEALRPAPAVRGRIPELCHRFGPIAVPADGEDASVAELNGLSVLDRRLHRARLDPVRRVRLWRRRRDSRSIGRHRWRWGHRRQGCVVGRSGGRRGGRCRHDGRRRDLWRATGSEDGERREQDGHDAGVGRPGSIGCHERIPHPKPVISRPAANDARLATKATPSARRGPRPWIAAR